MPPSLACEQTREPTFDLLRWLAPHPTEQTLAPGIAPSLSLANPLTITPPLLGHVFRKDTQFEHPGAGSLGCVRRIRTIVIEVTAAAVVTG
jgi:hypothetical protein